MPNIQEYFGSYYFIGLVLNVKFREGQLVASMPGVPEGYEVLLEPVGDDRFRNIGGPVDGSTLTFLRNEMNKVIGMQVDSFELVKINQDDLKKLPVIKRYPEPEFKRTYKKLAQFEKLLQICMAQADGAWIEYELPYAIHEFVQFVTAQDQIIFHGTNNLEIDEFQPIRKSMELHDQTGRGNIQGVYGTHDGLWSIFFSVVDRQRLQGSINNGVMYFQNQAGKQIAVYNFSINQAFLEERPYIEGALYFLPRETFRRLHLTSESYANEWVSEQPVKPIAKLKIQPEDFPFLEQIDGHDDGELYRLNTMSEQIREAAISATLDRDAFQVTLPKETEIASLIDEYIELQRVMMPSARFKIQSVDQGVKLIISHLPPAVRQMLSTQYQDLLTRD